MFLLSNLIENVKTLVECLCILIEGPCMLYEELHVTHIYIVRLGLDRLYRKDVYLIEKTFMRWET